MSGNLSCSADRISVVFSGGLSESTARDAVLICVRSYREHLTEFGEMNLLDLWYFAVDSEMLLATIDNPEMREKPPFAIESLIADVDHGRLGVEGGPSSRLVPPRAAPGLFR